MQVLSDDIADTQGVTTDRRPKSYSMDTVHGAGMVFDVESSTTAAARCLSDARFISQKVSLGILYVGENEPVQRVGETGRTHQKDERGSCRWRAKSYCMKAASVRGCCMPYPSQRIIEEAPSTDAILKMNMKIDLVIRSSPRL